MIPFSLQTLTNITSGLLSGADCAIDEVTTDTRKVTPGCLFIALIGERYDAHNFAEQAVAAGANALLVSKRLPLSVSQVVVNDTHQALGQLAAWVRQQSDAHIVALTGSSGKTSVKEMTAAILRECGPTLATAGNFNNDIGVPLTLLRLTAEHRYAVIELGANHQGEIAYTTSLVQPETALVNNLAAAHLEGFGSLAGIARAKGEIFAGLPADGTAIINAESHDWSNWRHLLCRQRVWCFSVSQQDNSDFYASEVQAEGAGYRFQLHTPQGTIAVMLPLPGQHNISNALAASALAISVGAPLTAIQRGLAAVRPVAGRLYPLWLAEHQLLLDDSYNANTGSMAAAVRVLAERPGFRVMVAGDMAELGADALQCHRDVGKLASQAGINKVLSVGTLSKALSDASGVGEHFSDKAELCERLLTLLSEHEIMTILIKGSRSAAMEQVVQALQERGSC